MTDLEPYRSKLLPDRFLRWLESLRKAVRPIPDFFMGDGSPEGVVSAKLAARYYDRISTALWYKTTDGGKTGWRGYSMFDYKLEVQKGNVPGTNYLRKFGVNPQVMLADINTAIWMGASAPGGQQAYLAPTATQTHDLASDNVQDVGSLIDTGSITSGTAGPPGTMFVSGALFVSGTPVNLGDLVLNDNQVVLGSVLVVTDEENLVINSWFNPENGDINNVPVAGDVYRIVRATGTGVSTMWTQRINDSRIEAVAFHILNGTTDVPMLDIYRINRQRVFGLGSGAAAAGVITSKDQSTTFNTAVINNGKHQTQQSMFTVPANRDYYIEKWTASLAGKNANNMEATILFGQFNDILYDNDPKALVANGTSTPPDQELGFQRIPGGTDVNQIVDSSANNQAVSGSHWGYLVDKAS